MNCSKIRNRRKNISPPPKTLQDSKRKHSPQTIKAEFKEEIGNEKMRVHRRATSTKRASKVKPKTQCGQSILRLL